MVTFTAWIKFSSIKVVNNILSARIAAKYLKYTRAKISSLYEPEKCNKTPDVSYSTSNIINLIPYVITCWLILMNLIVIPYCVVSLLYKIISYKSNVTNE